MDQHWMSMIRNDGELAGTGCERLQNGAEEISGWEAGPDRGWTAWNGKGPDLKTSENSGKLVIRAGIFTKEFPRKGLYKSI